MRNNFSNLLTFIIIALSLVSCSLINKKISIEKRVKIQSRIKSRTKSRKISSLPNSSESSNENNDYLLNKPVKIKHIITSFINTTYNTKKIVSYYEEDNNGDQHKILWKSSMGPLSYYPGGMVCDYNPLDDNVYRKYRHNKAAVWYIAPSDSLIKFGIKSCGEVQRDGSQPHCDLNRYLCGRKVRITCKDKKWCGKIGSQTILSRINKGQLPKNNYISDYSIKNLNKEVNNNSTVPKSIVVLISDFCPKYHSDNLKSGNCQGPQVDISTESFLMMGKMNRQGYIESHFYVDLELLPATDISTKIGPEY